MYADQSMSHATNATTLSARSCTSNKTITAELTDADSLEDPTEPNGGTAQKKLARANAMTPMTIKFTNCGAS